MTVARNLALLERMFCMTDTRFNGRRVESGMMDRPDHPDFDAVFSCYQKCFPLPTELESKENFQAVLAENQQGSKPGREMWVYLKDKVTGKVLGASNFAAFAAAPGHEIDGTCQDIYLFVDEKYRQQGISSMLIVLREQATANYLRELGVIDHARQARIYTFAEQNNPLMMTPAQYCEDSQAAIDQCLRRSIFERPIRRGDDGDRVPGFRTLRMRYVQPPLESEGEACDYLDYVVKLPDERTTVPAEIIRQHLDQFFAKCFPAGTSLEMPGVHGMRRDLETTRAIAMEPVGKFNRLAQHLSVDKLSSIPSESQNIRIGDLYPDLVEEHYGRGVTLAEAMESYSAIDEKNRDAQVSETSSAPKSSKRSNQKRLSH